MEITSFKKSSYICTVSQRESLYKTLVVRSMLVLYIFVSFFSVHFHHHSDSSFQSHHSHFVSDDSLHLADSHETDEEHSEQNDCLSCHYFQHHSGIEYSDFSYTWINSIIFTQEQSAYFQRFGNVSVPSSFLRGPPNFL